MLAVAALGFALRRLEGRSLADGSCGADAGGMSCLSFNFDDACDHIGSGSRRRAGNSRRRLSNCDANCDGPSPLPDCDGFTDGTSGTFSFKYKTGRRWCGYSESSASSLNVMQSIAYAELPMQAELSGLGLCPDCDAQSGDDGTLTYCGKLHVDDGGKGVHWHAHQDEETADGNTCWPHYDKCISAEPGDETARMRVRAMCAYMCGAMPDCVAWQTHKHKECLFFTGVAAGSSCDDWEDTAAPTSGDFQYDTIGCSPPPSPRPLPPCETRSSSIGEQECKKDGPACSDYECMRLTSQVGSIGKQAFTQARNRHCPHSERSAALTARGRAQSELRLLIVEYHDQPLQIGGSNGNQAFEQVRRLRACPRDPLRALLTTPRPRTARQWPLRGSADVRPEPSRAKVQAAEHHGRRHDAPTRLRPPG